LLTIPLEVLGSFEHVMSLNMFETSLNLTTYFSITKLSKVVSYKVLNLLQASTTQLMPIIHGSISFSSANTKRMRVFMFFL